MYICVTQIPGELGTQYTLINISASSYLSYLLLQIQTKK